MNDSLAHAKDALALGKLICDILEQVDISGIDLENPLNMKDLCMLVFKLRSSLLWCLNDVF